MPFLCTHFYMDTLESPCGLSISECDIIRVGKPVFVLILPEEVGKTALPQCFLKIILTPLAVSAVKLL